LATKDDAWRGRNQIVETKREMIKFSSSSSSSVEDSESQKKHQQDDTSKSFEDQDYGLVEMGGK
jgi:hypothetical protein